MNTLDAIKTRRSVRKFEDRKVDRKLIEELIHLATYSPTWANSQIVRYTVIDDQERIKRIAEEGIADFQHNQNIVSNAPGLVVVSMIKDKCGRDNKGELMTKKGDAWEMFDAGIATQTLSLAAHEKGLASVILGIFNPDIIGKIIKMPESETIATLIPFGYPVNESNMPPRKGLDEVLKFI